MVKVKYKRLLTVDPGFKTGWALWKNTLSPMTGQITLQEFECKDTVNQLEYMWREFDLLIKTTNPSLCIIEGVEFWGGSLRSYVSVRKRKGEDIADLFKLAYLIGGYLNICDTYAVETKVISFSKWGGQLTDAAVKSQVEHLLNKTFKTQHIYDAVGIGLNYHGKL